jgi:hypothetical protein
MTQYIHEARKHMHCMNKIRSGYQELLNRWAWEVHMTFYFANYVDFGIAVKQVKQWIGFHKITFKCIKYAGLILLANPRYDSPHAHVLLTSDPNYPRTLSDIRPISLNLLEHWWNKGSCKITTFRDWDNHKITTYLTKEKNISLYNPDRWDIYFIRPNLLLRLNRSPSNTGC